LAADPACDKTPLGSCFVSLHTLGTLLEFGSNRSLSFGRFVLPTTAALLALSSSPAQAIQRPAHLQGRAELELHPGTTSSALRDVRVRAYSAPARLGSAYQTLRTELGDELLARFDADTGVVAELIPRAVGVPGASASAEVAEAFARDFVARHLELLAPGSSPDDLILVSDESNHGVRTIGFAQHHAGLPVIGGQLSLSFKADRLIAVRSQALPRVSLPSRTSSVAPARAGERARAWIAKDFAAGDPDAGRVEAPAGAEMILPLVHAGGAIEYREVVSVEVTLDAPRGRWQVYLDAESGEPVARRSLVRWADLQIETWRRSPLGPRTNFPAAHLEVTVDGQQSFADAGGQLLLPVPGASVEFMPEGIYQRIVNAAGPEASVSTLLDSGQSFLWDLPTPEQDAQLSAYVHTQEVKDYIRAIDPGFAPLELQTTVTVNIDDVCNAFADENTLNFFLAGSGCENSALIADVVYHEYGHIAHVLGLQPGVGLFDGGVSEGASDYLGATMTGDPNVGVGFFASGAEPIRDLDPDGWEWHWPEDTGEVHDEGRIIGGTLWDLREALVQKYGPAEGVTKADAIWFGGIRRSVDTPSWYLEALITNDDDGDLQNGTPDICEINAAFAAHGLYQPLGAKLELERSELADGSLELRLAYGSPLELCPGSVDPTAVLRYRPRAEPGESEAIATEVEMAVVGPGELQAVIPPQPLHTVTQYQVELDWGNGTVAALPDNRADEWYERFTGPVTEIWCSDFEADNQGWVFDGDWGIGAPAGGGGDPSEAWLGSRVAGIVLDWPGTYSPNTYSSLTTPVIDTSGYGTVRLQYRRWLTVEDGYWDHAQILANGEPAWQNRASVVEELASVHHRDREWRFHDVELSDYIGDDGQLSLSFVLASDGGLEFGGWNIDEVCVVGHEPPAGGCGDGYVQMYEQCDDGNLQNGDGCSSGCLFEVDEPPPAEEPVDEGDWDPSGRGCGCTASDTGGPAGLGALALLGLAGLGRRRRRRT
jgi:MYXO-CTERM domain-containing protein